MKHENKVALVTGGNKGIGFETCRQLGKLGFQVILGSRNKENGEVAAKKLQAEDLKVISIKLDVTSHNDIDDTYGFIVQTYGKLDVLVNNAGIMIDSPSENSEGEGDKTSIFNAKLDTIRKSLETNTFGALQLTQKFSPLMVKNKYGRIVNLSSGMGQLSEMEGGWPGYRISKVALNAVTRIFAAELKGTPILINSVCPGWVRTDMGGQEAERSPEEGAETVVWLATLPEGGPSGGFFRDKHVIPW